MGRRRGEDSIASKKRRMPYVAKIKRDDPFRPVDEREIEAMCKRIAAAGEYMALAGWREDAGYRVFHFATLGEGTPYSGRPAPRPNRCKRGRSAWSSIWAAKVA